MASRFPSTASTRSTTGVPAASRWPLDAIDAPAASRRREGHDQDAARRTGHVLVVGGELDFYGLRVPFAELRLQGAAAVGRLLGIAALQDGRVELLLRRELAALLRATQRVHSF